VRIVLYIRGYRYQMILNRKFPVQLAGLLTTHVLNTFVSSSEYVQEYKLYPDFLKHSITLKTEKYNEQWVSFSLT